MSDESRNRTGKRTDLAVATFRLRNFKAIRDSGTVHFTPLTVLIGNNGVGKSSLIEGLKTLRSVAADGLDNAMGEWNGFEYIWNKGAAHTLRRTAEGKEYQTNPMTFEIAGAMRAGIVGSAGAAAFRGTSEITAGPGENEVFFLREELQQSPKDGPKRVVTRPTIGPVSDTTDGFEPVHVPIRPNESVLYAEPSFRLWQFVGLDPDRMGGPKLLSRGGGRLPLAPDGSNIAQYFLDIRTRDVIDGIVDTIRTLLPTEDSVQRATKSDPSKDHVDVSARVCGMASRVSR